MNKVSSPHWRGFLTSPHYMMNKSNKLLVVTFSIFVLIVCFAYTQEPATVRSIYIKPRDVAVPTPHVIAKFKGMIKGVQHYYRNEMERHGYGPKTFNIETDKDGDPKITVVHSEYDRKILLDRTSIIVEGVIMEDFAGDQNLFVVIVGGIELVNSIHGGLANRVDGGSCGGCRGVAILGEGDRSFEFSIMAHELGHVFGLSHILHTKGNFLMGRKGINDYPLADYEAHWLNIHPYFNGRGHDWSDGIPTVKKVHPPKAVGTDWIRYLIDIESGNELYQTQLMLHNNITIIGYDRINGHTDTAEFFVRREDMLGNDTWIHTIDSQGNHNAEYLRLEIPAPESIEIPNILSDRDGVTYLTIEHDGPNSLVPINSADQWDGWVEGVWEKTPDGKYPPKPQWYVNFWYVNIWRHWIYAHATSRIIWNLSDGDYSKFSCNFYLANPCDNVASVKLTFFADGKTIYDAGELRPDNAQNKSISFNIPINTKRFEVEVNNLGDGTCDHFVLGEPVLFSDVSASPPKPAIKMATQWAKLKHR